MQSFTKANQLITEFKGKSYLHGLDILTQIGTFAVPLGKRALIIRSEFPNSDGYFSELSQSLSSAEVTVLQTIPGAAPNAPIDDVSRIQSEIAATKPDFVVSFGGGSTIDAVKAAIVLYCLGGEIDDYFGTGLVTQKIAYSNTTLLPHFAIQTAASSSAHLTKYSNITNPQTGQKKLIVDDAIIPARAAFDYRVTFGAPKSLTADGALDGFSHALEVLYSAVGKPAYETILPVAMEALRLVIEYLPRVLENPQEPEGRQALGLATDLGGFAIMLGGTNGAHLTSFSLVDILTHGRACGLLNPYYTVFFAPAIEAPLQQIAELFHQRGYLGENATYLRGRELGLAVAGAMLNFQKRIGFPVTLAEVPGFTDEHIRRALTAAKNPQLKMKLENMPVPMTAEMVDTYMLPILLAAKTGDLAFIRNVP